MLRRVVGVVALAGALAASCAAGALASTAYGPRETVKQGFTTKRPGKPTGQTFSASYHAPGNLKGNPPYLRRIVFYAPRGFRFDTNVPAHCTAPDPVLQVAGDAACPAASRIGGGTVEGIFWFPITHSFVFDHYHHDVSVYNGVNQQIVLVKSEGYTVVRGDVRPDNSIDFHPPTCFPAPPTGCADDYILQLGSTTVLPAYTKRVNGRVRSYATTPPTCPASGRWRSRTRFSWSSGAVDDVVSTQPCV